MSPFPRYAAFLALAVIAAGFAEADVKRLRIEKGETIKPSAAKYQTIPVRKLEMPKREPRLIEADLRDPVVKEFSKRRTEIVATTLKSGQTILLDPIDEIAPGAEAEALARFKSALREIEINSAEEVD